MNVMYHITGISRLTGERESISMAVPKDLADNICSRFKKIPSKKRVYLRPKVEIYQEDLFNSIKEVQI